MHVGLPVCQTNLYANIYVRAYVCVRTLTHNCSAVSVKLKMISLISLHTLPASSLCAHPGDATLQVNFNVRGTKATLQSVRSVKWLCVGVRVHLCVTMCSAIGGGAAYSSVWCDRGSL